MVGLPLSNSGCHILSKVVASASTPVDGTRIWRGRLLEGPSYDLSDPLLVLRRVALAVLLDALFRLPGTSSACLVEVARGALVSDFGGRGVSRLLSLSMLPRLRLLPSSEADGSGELESKLRPSPLLFQLLSGVGGVNLCGIDEAVELCVGDLGVCIEVGGGANCD